MSYEITFAKIITLPRHKHFYYSVVVVQFIYIHRFDFLFGYIISSRSKNMYNLPILDELSLTLYNSDKPKIGRGFDSSTPLPSPPPIATFDSGPQQASIKVGHRILRPFAKNISAGPSAEAE